MTRTQGEWKAVEKRLQDKKATFHSYLTRKISGLVNEFKRCGECVSPANGEMIRRRHNIPVETFEKLEELASLMGKDVGTIVDEFVIGPMLQQDKDAAH